MPTSSAPAGTSMRSGTMRTSCWVQLTSAVTLDSSTAEQLGAAIEHRPQVERRLVDPDLSAG